MNTRTNEAWLRDLRGQGAEQTEALDDLRRYLERATLYFFSQHRGELQHLAPIEVEQVAQDVVQDALITILNHLDDFRGESKFTTWAYSFAINMALVELRRRRWKTLSLDDLLSHAETPDLALQDQHAADPHRIARQQEIWQVMREVIEHELTERQRQVLLAVAFQDVPVDLLTEELHTNRNALYKLVHDARVKLKKRLEERGFDVDEILNVFGPG